MHKLQKGFGALASVSETNQILSEKGNTVWCNEWRERWAPFLLSCVCVPGNSSIPPLINRFTGRTRLLIFDTMPYSGFCFNPHRYLTRKENSC